MKLVYKVIRTLLVTALVTAVGMPALLYVALSLPWVQDRLRKTAEEELTELLGTQVSIDHVWMQPFNRVALNGVTVRDPLEADKNILTVERLGAGISIWQLLKGDIAFTYAELMGMDLQLRQKSASAPLNLQPIIDRLSPKDKSKPPTQFSLEIATVVIRRSSLSFDRLDAPAAAEGQFNSRHIALHDLNADISCPRLANDNFDIDIRRLEFSDRSGLVVKNLSAKAHIGGEESVLQHLELSLPGSMIATASPVTWRYPSLDKFTKGLDLQHIKLTLARGSHVTPADLAPFYAPLRNITEPIQIALDAEGSYSDFAVSTLAVTHDAFNLKISGHVSGLNRGISEAEISLPEIDAEIILPKLQTVFSGMGIDIPQTIANGLGTINISGGGSLTQRIVAYKGEVSAKPGMISLEGNFNRADQSVAATVSGHALELEELLSAHSPVIITGLEAEIAARKGEFASFLGTVEGLKFRGYTYQPIKADLQLDGRNLKADVAMDDPNAEISIKGNFSIDPVALAAKGIVQMSNVDLHELGLIDKYQGYRLNATVVTDFSGTSLEKLNGTIDISDLAFRAPDADLPSLIPGDIHLTSQYYPDGGVSLDVDSDILEIYASGHFSYRTLPHTLVSLAASVNPELFPNFHSCGDPHADVLDLDISIPADNPLLTFLKVPIEPLTPIDILASVSGPEGLGRFQINAPYLCQKNKLIEGTQLMLLIDANEARSSLEATTTFPAKGGRVNLTITDAGIDHRHDTEIRWRGEKSHNYGNFRCTTSFSRDSVLNTRIGINQSDITFADTVWHVAPSVINIQPHLVSVDGFKIWHGEQLLSISGTASSSPGKELIVTLNDVNLDYVFETLHISDAVVFGGDATGVIHASELFSSDMRLYTDNLFVKGLSYNHCVMGDGHLQSAFHTDDKSISIDAVIDQANGLKSVINGRITPDRELLDFRFDADHAPVGFLQPFMKAFCSKISGEASGKAHLFGTFNDPDMEGKILGSNLAMDIDFTGTTYHTTDTITIRPGLIEFTDVKLTDDYGHTAMLSGSLTHKCFRNPVFRFDINEARDFLCYDVKPNNEHPWYGKIFGNGSASIKGAPGIVTIDVAMATAEGSDFTFVLSDEEVAAEYTFLTFRDATPEELRVVEELTDDTDPPLVRQLRERIARKANVDVPTNYVMTFNIDINPRARINLVMDPVGGDYIRAVGSGNMRMSYDAASEDLKMYGTYTVDRGRYNFTLQDIIVKDFTIEEGSSIAFHGDPYNAQLDIRAYYALNANLTDLDESFAQDRDLNRTNVPVRAMLYVTGDMRSPDLAFDIALPTLAPETYRKVRSIISTDEMMSQQIIYLLALNRFYTPEYMTATRGNELVSVASSTLSSRLSNMLGALSDKFSIAPAFRSDRGDFSDMEVDVALSSSLLNNRLLLNGTLGYRDNALNSSQFIGDFDIEYLLNRHGSIRLKAYNRYNDRNYYLKTALTTQGVGILFKRDFDDIFSFMRKLRHKERSAEGDSIQTPDESAPVATD